MTFLFCVGLGPVQDFIAAARRGRDLWFGSYLLSEASKAVAKAIVEREKSAEALIFPMPTNTTDLEPGSAMNVPNKVLAQIHSDPEQMGIEVVRAAKERVKALAAEAFKIVTMHRGQYNIRGEYNTKVANDQIADLLEVYWVALPQSAGDYSNVRSRLDQLLLARKNTRDFNAVRWGSGAPKSSIDGARETVLHLGKEHAMAAGRDLQLWNRQQIAAYRCREGEQLSGVDLMKRNGECPPKTYHRIASTAHVTAQPLLARIHKCMHGRPNDLEGEFKNYAEKLKKLANEDDGHDVERDEIKCRREDEKNLDPNDPIAKFEGRILFESRLPEILNRSTKLPDDSPKIADAQKALKLLLKAVADGQEPLPYYAILHADGDHMGKAIRAQSSIEGHRSISQKLSEFAGGVARTVRAYQGHPIYSGGDDVLALLPLHTALLCAKKLADDFASKLKQFNGLHGNSPTLSAGLAVVHFMDPMADSLALARLAEKEAKETYQRNALAVTVSKRGGADITIGGHWEVIKGQMDTFIRLHRTEQFPDGAAYEIRDLALSLKTSSDPDQEQKQAAGELRANLQKAAVSEAVRILLRKQAKSGTEKVKAETLARVLEFPDLHDPNTQAMAEADLRSRFNETLQHDPNYGIQRLENLANELIVARIFAQAQDLARSDLEGASHER